LRAALLVTCALAANAFADDAEDTVRADLVRRQTTSYDASGVKQSTAERSYDAAGHVERDVVRKADNSLVVEWDYTWDGDGRLASRRYEDGTGRHEERRFTYKLDAQHRVVERVLVDPAAPAGEFLLDTITWRGDGRDVETTRHYAHEGPYPSGTASYDASGHLTRQCNSTSCEMFEYDAHGQIARVRVQPHDGEHSYRVYDHDYDRAGRVTRERVGGTETTFTYNERGDVVERRDSMAGSAASRTTYRYDYR
jgi:YD repeat-containing protein